MNAKGLTAEQIAMDIWRNSDHSVEGGKITVSFACIEDAIRSARREAMRECLEEVTDTQRGLIYYASEIVGGIANRIRALITKEE